MRLYCVSMMINNVIKDVFHIVAKDNKTVRAQADKFMEDCQNCGLKEYAYDSYSFTVIDSVDGHDIELVKKTVE